MKYLISRSQKIEKKRDKVYIIHVDNGNGRPKCNAGGGYTPTDVAFDAWTCDRCKATK